MNKCDKEASCDGFNWKADGGNWSGRLKRLCENWKPVADGKDVHYYEKCTKANTKCDV